ncbi:zinc finger protein ZFP2-like [Maniola hyperantus]|uniref:zinc finger protein ZFP2-like n=1 Tax=Aphantopus hyperantus TaxID=2795564 RepID=UPI001569F0C9|nr:zinc finger protein 271 [Maniola hyperantus]
MMFDPPDFPYKELTESLRDHYGSDDLLFTNNTVVNDTISNESDNVKDTESFISTVETELSLNSNISGSYFNVENFPLLEVNGTNGLNSELYVVQPDSFFNYEPTLLDDNTVNQFLLPIQVSSEKNKETEDTGPHLLALHSCVICHEIFATDADLLDHTISLHCSDKEQEPRILSTSALDDPVLEDISNSSGINSECESLHAMQWFVCNVCERVLSTALETEPRELLCCTDLNGKSNINVRKFSTMFVCDYCSYLFANGEAMDRHRLICLGQEDFYTGEMDKSLLKLTSIPSEINGTNEKLYPNLEAASEQTTVRQRRPYSTGNNNKMWNCGSCNQLFATARDLYRHKRGEDRPAGTPLTAFVCEDCDKVLGSMCALHTHKKMHKVSKPGYPCRVCGRRFNQSGHLAIHMRMHTGERPYPCDLCSKAFKVKVERDDHRRTHTGERPFACAECPKTFTAAARLREHARIHTDQRPYKCDICGAAFRRPYARTVHTLIHTGEKPHECDVCGTAFRRSGDMWKHKRTLHGIQAVNGDAN